jgi:hypothetical protein
MDLVWQTCWAFEIIYDEVKTTWIVKNFMAFAIHNTIYHKMEIRFFKHICEIYSATMNTIMANIEFWVAFIHRDINSSNMLSEIS